MTSNKNALTNSTHSTLTGTDFGQHEKKLTLIYEQYIHLVLEYASPAWALYRTMLYKSSVAANKIHQQTTYITKHRYSHYKFISTCKGHNFQLQPVQIPITQAILCWHINKLHIASKLPYKHYTLDSSTPCPNTNLHIHTHFTNIAIQKLGCNTILGTPLLEIHHSEDALPRADSTPQQASLQASRCAGHLQKKSQ